MYFWELDGKVLNKTKGMFDRTAKVQPQCSACTLGDALITGCANGQLYVWSGTKVRRVVSERCWMRVGTDACWWCTSTDHNMKRHEKA